MDDWYWQHASVLMRLETPAYVYNCDVVRSRAVALKRAVNGCSLLVSLKANAVPGVVRCASAICERVDVTSLANAQSAVRAGFAAGACVYGGPGKSRRELLAALEFGVRWFSVESTRELEQLAEVGGRWPGVEVLLRFNPLIATAPGDGLEAMTSVSSHFGLTASECIDSIDEFGDRVSVRGLHIYLVSQVLDVDVYGRLWPLSMEMATPVLARCGPMPVVNLGGGFGVSYELGSSGLDMKSVSGVVGDISRSYPDVDLWFESGRYLFADAGVYLCSIMDVLERGGRQIAVVDGSMSQFLRPVLFPGIHRVGLLSSESGSAATHGTFVYKIVGRSCTPLDVMAEARLDREPRVGDRVAVLGAGAYGYSMSPFGFCGHGPPGQFLIEQGDVTAMSA